MGTRLDYPKWKIVAVAEQGAASGTKPPALVAELFARVTTRLAERHAHQP